MEIAFVPYLFLRLLGIRPEKLYHWNVLLSNLFLILLFALAGTLIGLFTGISHFCLFQRLTGIACPFCGTTTGLLHLFRGEVFLAWSANKVSVLLGLYLVYQVVARIILLSYSSGLKWKPERLSSTLSIVILSIYLINWIYNLIY